MKQTAILLFFLLTSLSDNIIQAQDFEFRLVNNQYLFSQVMSKAGPNIEREMSQYIDSLDYANRDEKREKESVIIKSKEALQNLEGTAKGFAQANIEGLINKYNTFINSLELEKQKRYEQLLAPYKKSLNEAIQAVADQNNIDHVIPTHDENGKQIVLYFSPQEAQKYDITLQVLEYLNNN